MDTHLENTIRLNKESKYENFYEWSLQEYDENGGKIGDAQIPWKWGLHFTASELRYQQSITINGSDVSDDKENNEQPYEAESILATLHSGICLDGKELKNDTLYTMFGANREIKKFVLHIEKLEDSDAQDRCHIWGSVSYTSEIDFRNETTDDEIHIYLSLAPKRFYKLVDLIKAKRADMLQVYLRDVSGFYSEWSPSISAYNIQVLTDSKEEQKIILPEGCEIDPPRLGQVGEFSISVVQRNIINPKQDFSAIDIDKLFEESTDYEEDFIEPEEAIETQPDVSSQLLAQLERNEKALAKLQTPLWLIFIILFLLLLMWLF